MSETCQVCFKPVESFMYIQIVNGLPIRGHKSCITENKSYLVKKSMQLRTQHPVLRDIRPEDMISCTACGVILNFKDARISLTHIGHPICVESCSEKEATQILPYAPAVKGVDPNAALETLETGAKQSKSPYRFDLLDPAAMFKLTELLAYGAEKYGVDNWRAIPVDSHLNHMLVHAYAFLAGDTSDDHLTHMLARALFAVAVDIQPVEGVCTCHKSNWDSLSCPKHAFKDSTE